jgi:hypothetical protein
MLQKTPKTPLIIIQKIAKTPLIMLQLYLYLHS